MPGTRTANLWVWLALWSALVGWQLTCLALRPRLPTFGDVVSALMRFAPSRWVLLGAWCWLGWHVFVRGSV